LNPNEDPRAHMWLTSSIFITKAVDSIGAYAHLGGDAAAHASHAKDAAGVRMLNKLDVEGGHLLGHTVVDWQGERWVCQSMLPGIFSRKKEEEEGEEGEGEANDDKVDGEKEDVEGKKGEKVNGGNEDGDVEANGNIEKKEEWAKVSAHSPTKSTDSTTSVSDKDHSYPDCSEPEDLGENPMIIYGLDSEHLTSLHWDTPTHRIMSKIASAHRLAEHQVVDGNGESKPFWASAEVKALRGTDGRRYLLDLPRLAPVDVEWLEKDMEGYPHRVVLLRQELVETFWESELKRWARGVPEAEKAKGSGVGENVKEDGEGGKTVDGDAKEHATKEMLDGDTIEDGEKEAPAPAKNEDTPVTIDASTLKQFELRFNPDAFVDQPAPRSSTSNTTFIPSRTTDESDPAIKAVREASVFLRQIAIPAIALDVLTGSTSGIMDGQSLSKHLHARGVNIRYLGLLMATCMQFSKGSDGVERESGHLAALKVRTMLSAGWRLHELMKV